MRHKVASIGRSSRIGGQSGMALITVMMVMMLMSVLMVGFVAAIVSDSRASGLDRDQTQAYAASHAGLEKLTADLSALFASDFNPIAADVYALSANYPTVPGFQYLAPDGTSGYTVTFTPDTAPGNVGNPKPLSDLGTMIKSGPYQGFKGIITQYDITTTARSAGGAEVRMRRSLQTIAVPVFQFGMFSETDLAFHAGETFAFGGRVHTNGNLFLAEGTGEILTLADRVTALGEIVRTHLPNGLAIASGYAGTIRVPVTISSPTNTYRNLASTEGSLIGAIGTSQNEPKWTNLSVGTYGSNIRNGRTGAKRLDLPLVSQGAQPIDLVRRPLQNSNENVVAPLIHGQRLYSQAALRILLSDTAAELTSLPLSKADGASPVSLIAAGNGYVAGVPTALHPPIARSTLLPLVADAALPADVYKTIDQSLLGGFIKIEMQLANKTWVDVTREILSLGIAGRNLATNNPGTALASRWNSAAAVCSDPNPDAIIRLQRVRDVPFDTTTANTPAMMDTACGYTRAGGVITAVSPRATDYWPNTLYDPREGHMRDGLAGTDLVLGGIMHYVELDVNNLRRWLQGTIGASGNQARNDNGFIVYFSDRRNNKSGPQGAPVAETGEYGWEDVVNPASVPGTPNGALDTGEDLNASAGLDTYGKWARNVNGGAAPFDAAALNTTVIASLANPFPKGALMARANRTVHFRRALKLVNGAQGNIITPGLTVASENPVYVQGNYNATAASVSTGVHSATAIIADSVTMLSNNWNDIRSFTAPTDSALRPASTTGYRVAVVSGKGLAFPKPSFADSSFGSDGGAHNFLRLLEDWNTPAATLRYRGSLVSFFISRQGTGTFKCCQADTYIRGVREMAFDTDFLTPSLLPPGTPMFRDINTLTFRQLLRPTQ